MRINRAHYGVRGREVYCRCNANSGFHLKARKARCLFHPCFFRRNVKKLCRTSVFFLQNDSGASKWPVVHVVLSLVRWCVSLRTVLGRLRRLPLRSLNERSREGFAVREGAHSRRSDSVSTQRRRVTSCCEINVLGKAQTFRQHHTPLMVAAIYIMKQLSPRKTECTSRYHPGPTISATAAEWVSWCGAEDVYGPVRVGPVLQP